MTTTATLVKRRTQNGLWEIGDHVPLGTTYAVLPWTARDMTALHESGVYHTARMVCTADGQWLPAELLAYAGNPEGGDA